MFEFTVFTLNQTNITSQSGVVVFINTIREIVSRTAALMNGEEASGSRVRRAEKAARRNGQRCHSNLVHIYIEKLFKKQQSFVNSS